MVVDSNLEDATMPISKPIATPQQLIPMELEQQAYENQGVDNTHNPLYLHAKWLSISDRWMGSE